MTDQHIAELRSLVERWRERSQKRSESPFIVVQGEARAISDSADELESLMDRIEAEQ